MDKVSYMKELKNISICREAIDWTEQFESSKEAWDACERGDWMLVLISKRCVGKPESDSRKKLVLTACDCARLVWNLMQDESKKTIMIAEDWAKGKEGITFDNVRCAAALAYAAVAAHSAGSQPIENDYASFAAVAATCPDIVFASYASAACYAEATKDAYVVERNIQKLCADIVRKHYPENIMDDRGQ